MLRHMARSSSGLGRRPLKAEITGSNPVRATIDCSGLLREPFCYKASLTSGSTVGFFNSSLHRILIRRKKFKFWLALLASAVIYFLAQRQQPSATGCILGCRLMAGQRILVPSMGFDSLHPSQCILYMARSSSGLGRRPLKAEITGSESGTGYHRLFRAPSGAFSLLAVVVAIL